MARIDDYVAALELARAGLRERDPRQVTDEAGANFEMEAGAGPCFRLRFLNRPVKGCWPELRCIYEDNGEEVPIQQQVLLLHFLGAEGKSAPTGDWIAYQEVPDGKFYLDAFLRRAKNPMLGTFGERPGRLVELAEKVYGAKRSEEGDASVVIEALPGVPVLLILWKGDEEFPPEGNILFDRSIVAALSAEDIAWLCGMIIYPLLGMAFQKS